MLEKLNKNHSSKGKILLELTERSNSRSKHKEHQGGTVAWLDHYPEFHSSKGANSPLVVAS